jgi:hypothetical protein
VLTLYSKEEGDERGFTESEDAQIRQVVHANHDLMVFRSLKSMTIVKAQGHMDLVLAQVDEKPGEYQAWNLGSKGQAEKPEPPKKYAGLDNDVFEAWNELELLAWVSPDAPKCMFRGVTADRLAHSPE